MEALGIYSVSALKSRLEAWNIASKKRWGQNFLIDKQISIKIVNSIFDIASHNTEPSVQDNLISTIWEIGPGLGAITAIMLERGIQAKRKIGLRLFEIDYGIIAMLKHYLLPQEMSSQVSISEGDAEKSIPKLVYNLASNATTGSTTADKLPQIICGNLPYSSGVRLIITCSKIAAQYNEHKYRQLQNTETQAREPQVGESQYRNPAETMAECPSRDVAQHTIPLQAIPMCVMLQKEGAERLVAEVGSKEYGISTVLLSASYNISILYEVAATCFYPAPNVESVMCSLLPRCDAPVLSLSQLKCLQSIVRASFAQRRKTLRNTLGKFLQSIEWQDYEQHCKHYCIDLSDRAENITPEQYTALAIALDGRAK